MLTVSQLFGCGARVEALGPTPECPLPATVQPPTAGSGFASTKQVSARATAAAIGCLVSTNTPLQAVPKAQVGGAHPRASSNWDMLTARMAGTLGRWHRKHGAGRAAASVLLYRTLATLAEALFLGPLASLWESQCLRKSVSACLSAPICVTVLHFLACTSLCRHTDRRKNPLSGSTWTALIK